MVEDKRKEVIQMVKVSIEIHSGAARFVVAVQAQSIQRALSIVAAHSPASLARMSCPIDPEGFFVEDPAARVGVI